MRKDIGLVPKEATIQGLNSWVFLWKHSFEVVMID